MTKAMTTVAALQLVEQGRLALEHPVAEVLPAFGELQVLDGFDGDEPRLRAPSRPPTIRDLMTHTSGLGYFFTNPDLLRSQEQTGTPSILTGQKAGLMAPLVHDPGAAWEYGISTDWLGHVVEEVAGAPLAPCSPTPSSARSAWPTRRSGPGEEQRARLMGLHMRTADGTLEPTPLDLPADPEFAAGAYATAGDQGRFLRALLRGGELDGARILRPATTELTNDVPELALRGA